MPQRKTRCRACGQFIYVRSTPDDRTRRLMTEEQMHAAEAAWSAQHAVAYATYERETFGSGAADFTDPTALPDLNSAIERAHALARGGPQTKMAVAGLYRAATSYTEALGVHLALALIELRQAQQIAFTAEVRCGVYDPRQHCGPCERVRGTVLSTDTPIEAVVPMDCPRVGEAFGRRRRQCNVTVSAWVTQPGGGHRIDRRPTPPREGPPMTAEQIERARVGWSKALGVGLPQAEPTPALPPGVSAQPTALSAQELPRPWWRRLLGLR